LSYYRTFKDKEHAKSEETVVPIFIEKPETTAKDLENEEWRHKMLFVNVEECGNGDVNFVRAPNLSSLFLFLLCG
jgi:hypothetical protein